MARHLSGRSFQVDASLFEAAHGRAPRGRGRWAFAVASNHTDALLLQRQHLDSPPQHSVECAVTCRCPLRPVVVVDGRFSDAARLAGEHAVALGVAPQAVRLFVLS